MRLQEIKVDTLHKWCVVACCRIRFRPDRDRVYSELMDHLLERKQDFLDKGFSQEEAEAKTLVVMGEPMEIARDLESIHRPFWGFFLRACRIAFIIVLCLSVLPVWRYFRSTAYRDPNPMGFALYDVSSYGEGTGRTLLHLSRQEESFSSDGSTFTVTDAALFRYEDNGRTLLCLNIRQTGILPWKERIRYVPTWSVAAAFTIVDSLGNVYISSEANRSAEGPFFSSNAERNGVFSGNIAVRVINIPEEVQWVDIRYQREGRDMVMRIDLTGGVVA